jgi:hypothetical protein
MFFRMMADLAPRSYLVIAHAASDIEAGTVQHLLEGAVAGDAPDNSKGVVSPAHEADVITGGGFGR